ncbi:AAA family ATPase [Staphylococcus caeli]|uniref:AAA family ATPase n=1 Tax=Staphylococcus caeli TaxID=2201815 RepID=UPI003F578150
MVKLIIIRGNSGSGKTTIARKLQHKLDDEGVLLIEQDIVRRQMLHVHDRHGNLAITLIAEILAFGIQHCDFIILEGILNKAKYGEMLDSFIKHEHVETHAYYFDLPFEETIHRHHSKKDTDFGEAAMAKWFVEHDTLQVKGEVCISSEMSEAQILNMIFNDVT